MYFKDQRESPKELVAYFKQRPGYKIKNGQAWYENKDTGVYFSFEWDPVAVEGSRNKRLQILFNLNFYRPTGFALEAEPEVSALVQHFDLAIEDPQIMGMNSGPYSREKFMAGWEAGNLVAYMSMVPAYESAGRLFALPSELLKFCWSWNRQRKDLQAQVGNAIFAPIIVYCCYKGELMTAVSWIDAIPTVLPAVDAFILLSSMSKRWRFLTPKPAMAIAPSQSFLNLLEQYPIEGVDKPFRRLNYDRTPESITTKFKEFLPVSRDELKILPFDQVLDREVVEEARRRLNNTKT